MAKSRIVIFSAVAVCVLIGVSAEAGNRHGESSVCESAGLVGAAYAACHVYCESLDCDSDTPSASESACSNALARFGDLTGGSTPPCEPVCPCASAWRGPGFFPENPTSSECLVEGNDADFAHMHVELIDEATGSSAYVSVDFWDSSDPGDPMTLVACSTMQGPDPWGLPGTGGFELVDRYAESSESIDRLQQEIFNSCKAEFLALVSQLEIECEVNDLSGK